MRVFPQALPLVAVAGVIGLCSTAAQAQTASAPAWVSKGYQGAASTVATPVNANTRDASNNRVIINGEIQTAGSSSVQSQFMALTGGAGTTSTGAGANTYTATAIANLVDVQVTGSWNTVIVNANQTNTGNVTATSGAAQQKVSGNGTN